MEIWLCTAAVFLFAAAGLWIWHTHNHMRRIMAHMIKMLEDAEEGSFQEEVYDESMISAVETRMAHVLSALEVSVCQFREEKENVEQLISDISHQTKTPIANLLLYAQMLEERSLPAEERAFPPDSGGAWPQGTSLRAVTEWRWPALRSWRRRRKASCPGT